MSHREQELVDQHRAWRAELDKMPEPEWHAEPRPVTSPREERLAARREERAKRLARPLNSPELSPADTREGGAVEMRPVRKLAYQPPSKEDAEFAKWRRDRLYASRRSGSRRSSRSKG